MRARREGGASFASSRVSASAGCSWRPSTPRRSRRSGPGSARTPVWGSGSSRCPSPAGGTCGNGTGSRGSSSSSADSAPLEALGSTFTPKNGSTSSSTPRTRSTGFPRLAWISTWPPFGGRLVGRVTTSSDLVSLLGLNGRLDKVLDHAGVRFFGTTGNARMVAAGYELVRLVASASAALFHGLREEGGLARAEAMSMGTPVVVLSHGGPRDIAARARRLTRSA